jgi:Flp pilus assembly protein TadG
VGHKLLRDLSGSVLVEYTIVFPLFMLLVLGTIDVSSMLSEWAMASKAANIGARTAVVADAVASGITSPTYSTTLTNDLCFNPSTGASTGNCPTITSTDCTGAASGGNCTNSYIWSDTPFTTYIFPRMLAVYPGLQRQNVTVSYAPGSYTVGFVGRPGGLPMNVTVSITGKVHQFYFIGPIMKFFGGLFPNTVTVPSFSSTLPSEAMNSANL